MVLHLALPMCASGAPRRLFREMIRNYCSSGTLVNDLFALEIDRRSLLDTTCDV